MFGIINNDQVALLQCQVKFVVFFYMCDAQTLRLTTFVAFSFLKVLQSLFFNDVWCFYFAES